MTIMSFRVMAASLASLKRDGPVMGLNRLPVSLYAEMAFLKEMKSAMMGTRMMKIIAQTLVQL